MIAVLIAKSVAISRAAILLQPNIIRATIPLGVIGVYCVYRKRIPIYVGRSDRCIRARLLAHAASGLGTHFTYEVTSNAAGAFLVESLWYHHLRDSGSGLNRVHPARPLAKGAPSCPICDEQHRSALQSALRCCQQGK